MRKLAEKRWTRVLAAILLLVFVLLSALASVLVRYGRNDNWYHVGQDTGFESTSSCLEYVAQANYYVEQNVRWREDRTLDFLGSYAGAAYSYQILDEAGKVLADTTTENSVFVADDSVALSEQPSFTVRGYVNLPVEPYEGCYAEYAMFTAFFGYRYLLLALKILFLLLAALMLVILCLGAARRGRERGLASLLNKPYDLFFVILLLAYWLCSYLFNTVVSRLLFTFTIYVGTWPDGIYWAAYEGARYLVTLGFIAFALWYLSGQLGAGTLRKNLLLARLFAVIPLWVFLLVFLGAHLLLSVMVSLGVYLGGLPELLLIVCDILAGIALILYARQERRIRQAAEELASGNLTYHIDTKHLHFAWKKLGACLNRIGDGMAQAVEDRMRSERMKTELITNVSHDLKTPLTSLINYIELLKSDALDEETRREYLDILDRQSGRLKKLTEDVVEASKAASGSLTACMEPIDTVELLEQFLGEYAGRFQAAALEPVLTPPEQETVIWADSMLLSRVIDNLITNILKYAQPETRVYFDIVGRGEAVGIDVKNISRDPLNISEDELMERFVRGDSSRHSEGSGLGLSIARSLTELMGGTLRLVLDGDLFKAELTFQRCVSDEQMPKTAADAVN